MKKKNNKGFTLAEMLIVVAIIGILIAILVPTFTTQLSKAKKSADLANIRSYVAEVTANGLAGETASGSLTKEFDGQYSGSLDGEVVGGVKIAGSGNTYVITYSGGTVTVTAK